MAKIDEEIFKTINRLEIKIEINRYQHFFQSINPSKSLHFVNFKLKIPKTLTFFYCETQFLFKADNFLVMSLLMTLQMSK